MCAIGRGLMAAPKLLLLDEPSLGLAPVTVKLIFENLRAINARGTTVLLASHDASLQQHLEARVMTLEHGKVLGSHGANR